MGLRALGLLFVPLLVGGLAGCAEPDPKAECVRYRVEMNLVEGKWSAAPPIGMDLVQESNYRYRYELEHPNYAAERNAIRQRFSQKLRTRDIDQFCQAYGD